MHRDDHAPTSNGERTGESTQWSRRTFLSASLAAGAGAAAMGASSPAAAQSAGGLSNPNATDEAVAVYNYLRATSGEKILSGQEYELWGIDEMDHIRQVTGRQPAIMGLDFIHPDQNDWRVQNAIDHWERGGIPTIMWHWGAPSVGQGYEESKAEIDVWRCFEEGTPEYEDMWSDLEQTADRLEELKNAGVPVLWRPMHELTGDWFWWSKSGPEAFKELWRTMYDYFVDERGLDNLVWVLCYSGNVDGSWSPGREYFDVAGPDTYGAGRSSSVGMYDDAVATHGEEIPIAFHECGTPPDPDQCAADGAWWSWWMQWHTNHLQETDESYLDEVYNHDLIVTLDEMPDDIVGQYGPGSGSETETPTPGGGSCEPTAVDPYLQVDGGSWQNTASVTVQPGTPVKFGPHPTEGGAWSWSGPNVSGSSREIAVEPDATATYIATYTNDCGESSTREFTLTVESGQTETPDTGGQPRDLDGDGLSEDVNGNGEADFGDVTELFDSMDAVEDGSQFDFNGNGELDFGDVVALFGEM